MANMQICSNGHYYDGNRYTECPYCKGGDPNATVPVPDPIPDPGPSPVDVKNGGGNSNDNRDGDTIAIDSIPMTNNVRPVVGWLVCVDGPDKGRDYRLHMNYNYVGRSSEMDVAIRNDDAISRQRHFSVMYDKRHDSFLAFMGGGEEIVYLNSKPLSPAGTPITSGDVLEVGHSKLVFVAFGYKWEEQE